MTSLPFFRRNLEIGEHRCALHRCPDILGAICWDPRAVFFMATSAAQWTECDSKRRRCVAMRSLRESVASESHCTCHRQEPIIIMCPTRSALCSGECCASVPAFACGIIDSVQIATSLFLEATSSLSSSLCAGGGGDSVSIHCFGRSCGTDICGGGKLSLEENRGNARSRSSHLAPTYHSWSTRAHPGVLALVLQYHALEERSVTHCAWRIERHGSGRSPHVVWSVCWRRCMDGARWRRVEWPRRITSTRSRRSSSPSAPRPRRSAPLLELGVCSVRIRR